MAFFFRHSRKSILPLYKILIGNRQKPSAESYKLILNSLLQSRPYISEMRQAALENNMLRHIRQEIDFSLDNLPPEPKQKFGSFDADVCPGAQLLILKRMLNDEEIMIEVTMFRSYFPVSIKMEKKLPHNVPCIVSIQKDGRDNVMQFICTVWERELQINQVCVHKTDVNPLHIYMGPQFGDMEDELQAALYVYLESRGIDDDLAFYMFRLVKHKAGKDYIEWLRVINMFMEQKKSKLKSRKSKLQVS